MGDVDEQPKEPKYPFRPRIFIVIVGFIALIGFLYIIGQDQKENSTTVPAYTPQVATTPDSAPTAGDTTSASTSGPVADSDSRQGEAIDYMDYYVKSQTGGVPVGKRYNFTAIVSSDFTIKNPDANITGVPHFLQGADAFDSDAARERFLRISDTKPKWVIVEMSPDGITLVHDIY